MLGSPRPVGTCDARVTDNPLDGEAVPHEKHNQRTDCRTDRTRTLIRPIPADALAEPGRNECACNAKRDRDDKALRVIGPGRRNRAMTPAMRPTTKIQRRPLTRPPRSKLRPRLKNEVWAKEFRRYANVRYLERKLMRGTTVRFLGNRFGTHASIRRPKACFFAPTGNL